MSKVITTFLLLLLSISFYGQKVINEYDFEAKKTLINYGNDLVVFSDYHIYYSDSLGNLSSEKHIPVRVIDALQTNDSLYIVLSVDGASGSRKMILTYFNKNFDVIKSKIIDSKLKDNAPSSLISLTDTTLIISGINTVWNDGHAIKKLILSKVDLNGDTIWTKKYDDLVLDNISPKINMVKIDDINLLVSNADYLLKINSEGILLISSKYGDRFMDNSGFLKLSDGVLIAGHTLRDSYDLSLTKINNNMDTIWSQIYALSDHVQYPQLIKHPEFDLFEVIANHSINGANAFTYLQINNSGDTLSSFFYEDLVYGIVSNFFRYKGRIILERNYYGDDKSSITSFSDLNIDIPQKNLYLVCGDSVIISPNVYCFDSSGFDVEWQQSKFINNNRILEQSIRPDTTSKYFISINSLFHSVADSIFIIVNNIPNQVYSNKDNLTCGDDSIGLGNSFFGSATYKTNYYDVSWYPKYNMTSNETYARVIPDRTIQYYCKISFKGCVSLDSVLIEYNPTDFNIDFIADKYLLTEPLFAFQFTNTTPSISNYNFTWDFGDGKKKTSDNESIFHEYETNGLFNVKLIAIDTSSGCVDSTLKEELIFCTGGNDNLNSIQSKKEFDIVVLPTIFTDELTISNNTNRLLDVTIYSDQLFEVYNYNINGLSNHKIDTIDWPIGVFFVRVRKNDRENVFKVFKWK